MLLEFHSDDLKFSPVATVDLRSSAVAYRQLVFRRHLPSAGPHVLEIRPLGDGRVDLDAIVALR